jgi:hypothetical protein
VPIINADLDETGLTIADRVISGPPDHPELTVRTYVPDAPATVPGSSTCTVVVTSWAASNPSMRARR